MVMLAKQLQQVIHNDGTVLHSKALEVLRLCSLSGRLYYTLKADRKEVGTNTDANCALTLAFL